MQVAPKVPTAWESFGVRNYRTRFGEISYELKRATEAISLELTKPPVAVVVVLGPLPEIRRVMVNGVEEKAQLSETPEGMVAKVRYSGKLERVSIKVVHGHSDYRR